MSFAARNRRVSSSSNASSSARISRTLPASRASWTTGIGSLRVAITRRRFALARRSASPERPADPSVLHEVQVVDDHGHDGEAERLADLLPQLPMIEGSLLGRGGSPARFLGSTAAAASFCHSQPERIRA